jgi:hypothetical protein
MEKFDTKQFEKEAELWQRVNPRLITKGARAQVFSPKSDWKL